MKKRTRDLAKILASPEARRRLPLQQTPFYLQLLPGVAIGYRRNFSAGSWAFRCTVRSRHQRVAVIARADDLTPADNYRVLSFDQAKARIVLLLQPGGDWSEVIKRIAAARREALLPWAEKPRDSVLIPLLAAELAARPSPQSPSHSAADAAPGPPLDVLIRLLAEQIAAAGAAAKTIHAPGTTPSHAEAAAREPELTFHQPTVPTTASEKGSLAGTLPKDLIAPPPPGEPAVTMKLRLSIYANLVRLARGLGDEQVVQRLMEHAVVEFLQRHQREVELGSALVPF